MSITENRAAGTTQGREIRCNFRDFRLARSVPSCLLCRAARLPSHPIIHLPVSTSRYARQMRREIWIVAAWMVQKHGDQAVAAVGDRLAAIEGDGADAHHLEVWCQIARAVIELVRPRPTTGEALQ